MEHAKELKLKETSFPLPLFVVAALAAFILTWLLYPGVVLSDILIMSAGSALAFSGIAYIAYVITQRIKSHEIESERNKRARRVAWITLLVVVLGNASPLIT